MNWKLTAILGSLFIFGFLENLFPFFHYKLGFFNRISTNFSLGLLNAIATSLTTTLLLTWVWTQTAGIGLLKVSIQQPLAVGILSFLLLDLYMYAWHRLMHTLSIAWRFHRVHHTERNMNISTAYRFHAVEVLCSQLPKIFLIGLLGITPQILFVYELIFTVSLVFHHSNWALPLNVDRFLTNFIVTPNYHRIHHSQIVKETNSNYASLLSIWDKLFHSFRDHSYPQAIKIGLQEVPKDLNLATLLKLPF
jgi:sterol desaturase/sphingolipid hydroxylase (fatty acid hydroxylase superfamily)